MKKLYFVILMAGLMLVYIRPSRANIVDVGLRYSRLSRPILTLYKVITVAFHKDCSSGASRGEAKHLNRFSKCTSAGVR